MLNNLKKFAMDTVGTAVLVALMTVYFWVMYWTSTSIWAYLNSLVE